MLLSLIMTLSRSGISGILVALMLATFIMTTRQGSTNKRVLLVLYVVLALLATVSWVGLDAIAERFASFDPNNISERPAIWADTIRIIKDFWLTGTGLNTFGVSTLLYQTAHPGLHLMAAHNDYLQVAAEGGLLVAIPAVLAIFVLARSIRLRLKNDLGSIWWVRMGAVTGLIAIGLQSLVDFSLQIPGNALLFVLLCAIALHDSNPNSLATDSSDA
jgi:O-antigen ligase